MVMQPCRAALSFLIFSILISLSTSAQVIVKNYEKEWRQVETLVKKQLPRSALEEVNKIYQLARREKQDAQIIKALVYMVSLQQGVTENGDIQGTSDLEKELTTAR